MWPNLLIAYLAGVPTIFFWLIRSNSILFKWDKAEHQERVEKEGKFRYKDGPYGTHYWRVKSPEWRKARIWNRTILISIFWPIAISVYSLVKIFCSIINIIAWIFINSKNFFVKIEE